MTGRANASDRILELKRLILENESVLGDIAYSAFILRWNTMSQETRDLYSAMSSDTIPTAGLLFKDNKYTVEYNPEYIDQLDDASLLQLIIHETAHFYFKHDLKLIEYREDPRTNRLRNIGLDMWVNEFSLELSQHLFPQHPGLDAYYYSDFFSKNSHYRQVDVHQIFYALLKYSDANPESEFAQKEDADIHQDFTATEIAAVTSAYKLIDIETKQLVEQLKSQDMKSENVDTDSESSKEASYDIKMLIKLKGFLDDISFINSDEYQYTYSRPSRTFKTLPGRFKPQQSVSVAFILDTSGSVTKSEFESFLAALMYAKKNGIEGYILSCDSRLRSTEVSLADFKGQFKRVGFGGTNLLPALEKAMKYEDVGRICILTDGRFNLTIPKTDKEIFIYYTDVPVVTTRKVTQLPLK
jgi:predicted metal-dependent peptidase